MNTQIVNIDPDNIDQDVINEAGEVIKRGGIVAFPTETVYGLGGDALNPESSAKIYEAKGRPSDNPLIVHIADQESLERIVKTVPDNARVLMERFWPGPLTLIFEKSDEVPYKTTGGLDTVAVRFPSDPVAAAFIRSGGGYIAAPSANISGRPSPTKAEYVINDLSGRVDMIITGPDSEIGLESTIVDLTSQVPAVLRPGFITFEQLKEVLPDIKMDPGLRPDSDEAPKAPGMKYRHYAPNGDLTIVSGEPEAVTAYINERIKKDRQEGKICGVIAGSDRIKAYDADIVLSSGTDGSFKEAAHDLFTNLRKMDQAYADVIYAEALPDAGIGTAYMNRLKKAAGGKVVNV